MIHIRAIDHLVLRVVNLDAMLAFYTDVLGCTLVRCEEEQGLWQLRAGSGLIDLVPCDKPLGRAGGDVPDGQRRNMDHFCLRIEPFDEAALRIHLRNFGVEASPTAPRYGAEGRGPSLYIADPEGNVIELKGPPDNHG
ncbi:MAG: VOC family protein [Rhodocyclaceae bacterium]